MTTLDAVTLSAWSRAMRHGLEAGLSPVRVLQQQAKSGPRAGRELAATIAKELAAGGSLAESLNPRRGVFPKLFVDLTVLGEETGRLTETFSQLETYFNQQTTAKRELMAALAWPIFQLGAAAVIIALMLLVLGLIAPSGGKAFDPLGLGLTGPRGAAIWLAMCAMSAGAVFFLVRAASRDENLHDQVLARALVVPGLGAGARAFALSRFSTGLAMANEAGISADRMLKLAFQVSGNAAYQRASAPAVKSVKKGGTLTDALRGSPQLFPPDYLDAAEVGETSGQFAEVMTRLARNYGEEGARHLKAVTKMAGYAVYLMAACLIMVVLYRLVSSVAGVYGEAMKGI